MKNINASIVTIGDELLIGQVIDTNSAFIAQELNKIGIGINRRVAVGDIADDIWNALDEESIHSDIILITGGLGPTADDITKPLLCKYFDSTLIVNEEALINIKNIFASRNILTQNVKQAEVPDNCIVIQNSCGTAPGMWFEKNGKIFISMPGVPHEMKAMISNYVCAHLQEKYTLPFIYHRTLVTAGQGESVINQRIKDWEAQLSKNIKLAYLPDTGKVRLRLSASGTKDDDVKNNVDIAFDQLQRLLLDITVANEDLSIEQAIANLLFEQHRTVATAESCTAGNIAHKLGSIPGASRYLQGGIVSYSNEVKHNILGVKTETLNAFGAVSEETVIEMVTAVQQKMQTDYAVAVSGILGPTGGSELKPVGTVWIAVSSIFGVDTKKFQFRYNDRERNMQATTTAALNMLRIKIKASN